MPVARFYKTLFLPPLEGQYLVWKHQFSQLANKVDEIVQLGNIIGCYERVKDKQRLGPNLASLNYTLLWRATFPNWTQITGPNEIMALNFPDEWTNEESNRALRSRWLLPEGEGLFQVAAVNKKRLVSHGGLSYGEWLSLGRPETAEEAAAALNEKYARTLFQGHCYRTAGRPSSYANPIFADPLREVYPSWIMAPEAPPFGQVHAAGGFNTLDGRKALDAPFTALEHVDSVSYTNFGSVVTIGDALFYSVFTDMPQDKLVKRLPEPWQAYIEKTPVVDMRDELFEPEEDSEAP